MLDRLKALIGRVHDERVTTKPQRTPVGEIFTWPHDGRRFRITRHVGPDAYGGWIHYGVRLDRHEETENA